MKPRKAAVVFIFITVMLDMLALGLIAPVLPKLILDFILGPAIGGPLGDVSPRLPFWVAAGFSLTNWLYGYIFVPESLRLEHRKAFTLRRANPVGSLVLLRSHPELWKLATLQFLAYVSHEVFVIWALYAIYRFAWHQTMVGISLAVVGIFTAAISGGLTGRIVAWLGERRTLYIGQFFGAVGMVMAGIARSGTLYIASIPVISMLNISFPAAQGMMTHRVSEREQGELQGAIGSLRSIAFVIGPFWFSGIFAWFINPKHSFQLPGAPYYLAAALLFTALIMATRLEQPEFTQPTEKTIDGEEVVPQGGISPGISPIVDPKESI